MQPDEYERMRAAEDTHWWYEVQRRLVLEALSRKVPQNARVLDSGCGTGGMLTLLKDYSAFGIDAADLAVKLCKERGLENVELARVESVPFPDGFFDAVLCLDVLYHTEVDEEAALAEIRRVLRPSGHLILNLPAFECLRGAHDIAVSGARRYRASSFAKLLKNQGFKVHQMHYWNAWTFIPMWAWRSWSLSRSRESVPSDLQSLPGWANTAFSHLGWFDARLCRTLRLPFGSSLFVVACSG